MEPTGERPIFNVSLTPTRRTLFIPVIGLLYANKIGGAIFAQLTRKMIR